MTEPVEYKTEAIDSARPNASRSIDSRQDPELEAPSAAQVENPIGLPVLPPVTAMAEILLLIVLPAALDFMLPAFPSLADFQPHLFWLPILLVSLQYGTISGLVAAGVAIAASAVLGWPEQEPGENHFSYLLRVWAQPILWLSAALLLGQFRMRQIERKQELARQVAELASQRNSIAEFARNLRLRCEALERQLANRRWPNSRDLLTELARLRDGEKASAKGVADALELAFGPCQASIYSLSGNGLQLAESFGWPPNAGRSSSFEASHPLARAVVGEARSVSILHAADEAVLAGEGLAAVPILSPDGTRITGVLKLEVAEPNSVDELLTDRMHVIAAAMSRIVEPGQRQFSAARFATAKDPIARPRLWRHVRRQPASPRQAGRVGGAE